MKLDQIVRIHNIQHTCLCIADKRLCLCTCMSHKSNESCFILNTEKGKHMVNLDKTEFYLIFALRQLHF